MIYCHAYKHTRILKTIGSTFVMFLLAYVILLVFFETTQSATQELFWYDFIQHKMYSITIIMVISL